MRRVLMPDGLDALWRAVSEHPTAAFFAGGTDLLVRLRRGLVEADTLICLERLPELKEVRDLGDRVFLGAGASLQSLLDHPLVADGFPVLHQAMSVLGSPAVRHMATLGGNVATASPAGDTLPPLYALEAEVELWSRGGVRRLPVRDFILGPGRVSLAPGEIVGGVWLARRPGLNLQHYEKVGARNSLAISIASLAAAAEVGTDGVVRRARLAWGSVGPTVVCSREADRALEGRKLTPENLARAGRLAGEAAAPISDLRADREYRLALVANLPLRLAGGTG